MKEKGKAKYEEMMGNLNASSRCAKFPKSLNAHQPGNSLNMSLGVFKETSLHRYD